MTIPIEIAIIGFAAGIATVITILLHDKQLVQDKCGNWYLRSLK